MSIQRIVDRNGRPRDDTPSNRDQIRIQLWTGIISQFLGHPLIHNNPDGSVVTQTVTGRAEESISAANQALAQFDANFPG